MDSKALSLFGRFGYAVTDTMRLDLIASRFELEGDGDYAPVAGDKIGGLPTSAGTGVPPGVPATNRTESVALRSEEHTFELQSLMRTSYAVFCLKTKQRILNKNTQDTNSHTY